MPNHVFCEGDLRRDAAALLLHRITGRGVSPMLWRAFEAFPAPGWYGRFQRERCSISAIQSGVLCPPEKDAWPPSDRAAFAKCPCLAPLDFVKRYNIHLY